MASPETRGQASNPVDAPPISARSHVVNDQATISRAVAAAYRRRAALRRQQLARLIVPAALIIAAYPVAAFLAQLAGNPVP